MGRQVSRPIPDTSIFDLRLSRRGLRLKMGGQAVVTHTTNVIFRCPDLVSLHDKGKAYRYICIGPEGTWATIVAINGRLASPARIGLQP